MYRQMQNDLLGANVVIQIGEDSDMEQNGKDNMVKSGCIVDLFF